MQTALLVATGFATVAAQFPGNLPPIPGGIPIPGGPLPGIPEVDCFNVLSQVCSDADTDLCQQCTNGLSFILNRAGCTQANYDEYCNDGLKCEDALSQQFGCTKKGTTADQCYKCAQDNQQPLLALGCTQAILVEECETLPQQGNGNCRDTLKQLCGDLEMQGDFCLDCVEANVQPLVNAGCEYNATTAFCKGNAPDMDCEKALEYACGDYFQAGTDCFHCLADKQDVIRKAGCQNDQLSGFCTPRHVPEPPSPPPPACTTLMSQQCPKSQNNNQVTCLRCVSADFESLMRVGCTKEEVIGYCS